MLCQLRIPGAVSKQRIRGVCVDAAANGYYMVELIDGPTAEFDDLDLLTE